MVDPACSGDGVAHARCLEYFVALDEKLQVAVNATFDIVVQVEVISERVLSHRDCRAIWQQDLLVQLGNLKVGGVVGPGGPRSLVADLAVLGDDDAALDDGVHGVLPLVFGVAHHKHTVRMKVHS